MNRVAANKHYLSSGRACLGISGVYLVWGADNIGDFGVLRLRLAVYSEGVLPAASKRIHIPKEGLSNRRLWETRQEADKNNRNAFGHGAGCGIGDQNKHRSS